MKIPRDGFDLIAVGGGIAGASLAQCVAEAGARVLILEAAEQFTDRVRGECLMPWGLTEAHALGLTGVLAEANVIRWANSYLGPFQTERRDLPATTAGKNPIVSFYHPQMQTRLLQAAEAAGTHVQRGMRVVSATGGHPVRVLCESGGTHHEVRGRLAAIATGRTSGLARALGFEVSRDNHNLCIAGVLLEGLHIPDDTLHWFLNPDAGEIAGWVPEGNAWVRT
ncbi:MAG: FAD-dependent oxidoreductase, partial [Terriglobales bacterium]